MDHTKDNEILGIAVSGTGQIDGSIGKVIGGNPNNSSLMEQTLSRSLKINLNIPAVLENDVNCAALGEKWQFNNILCYYPMVDCVNGDIFQGVLCVAGEFDMSNRKKW